MQWASNGFSVVFLSVLDETVKCLPTLFPRHAGVLELSMEKLHDSSRDNDGFAAFLNHDLSMLRLIEAFSESAPQLVLMLTIILRQNQFDLVTGTEKKKLQSGMACSTPSVLSYIY